jgi:MoxR-like ATPase
MILADEINRTPPKTQAALLEAMQEHQVTVAGQTFILEEPFFVLATQNPIEMEGTYPLPEAQLDRFMLNVVIDYLNEDDEVAVVTQTTSRNPEPIQAAFSGADLMRCHDVVRRVPVADEVARYAVRLAAATRPHRKEAPEFVNEWVNWGAGTRASQYMVLGGKTRAVLQGRAHVTFDDIKALARPVMRHRIQLNYRAEAEGMNNDKLIAKLIETVPAKL